MSAITWTAEAPIAPLISSEALKTGARRLGLLKDDAGQMSPATVFSLSGVVGAALGSFMFLDLGFDVQSQYFMAKYQCGGPWGPSCF